MTEKDSAIKPLPDISDAQLSTTISRFPINPVRTPKKHPTAMGVQVRPLLNKFDSPLQLSPRREKEESKMDDMRNKTTTADF